MKSTTVCIVDYGMGNLLSIKRAVLYVGGTPEITSDPLKIATADRLILPGVGAFGKAMSELTQRNLLAPLLDFATKERPLLGICLGMQLLLSQGTEFGIHQGLDLIKGQVVAFPLLQSELETLRIPQMGWNKIDPVRSWDHTILKGIEPGSFFYFVHSYICVPENKEDILTETQYGSTRFASVLSKNNIWGCQFHPEKSSAPGLAIYQNFLNL